MANRLALGTVQFGIPYGIANVSGQVDYSEGAAILRRAAAEGIDTLDTAIAYGESEKVLGQIGVSDWQIVTKLPKMPDDCSDASVWVRGQVKSSLLRLNVKHLKGVLLHHPDQLLGLQGKDLWAGLQMLKNDGTVKKIGFSIYAPDILDKLWFSFCPDLVQAPFNILDRRLVTSGWLQRMHEEGVEVHVRSVFLQGLLLMNQSNRPEKFNYWSSLWDFLDRWLVGKEITAIQGSLGFVLADPRIDRVVVGVDTLKQLVEILSSAQPDIAKFPKELEIDDLDLIDPSRWSTL